MIVVQGKDIPMSLQLIKGDSTFETEAIVKYTIYKSDGLTEAVSEQTTVYDSILKTYYDELDVSILWSDQEIGNYLIIWDILNASEGFVSKQVENLSVMAGEVETGLDMTEAMRIILSVLAGKASGGGTSTNTFRDINDTQDRVIATTDKRGNRTAIILDAS